ncbi:hypothetical protein CHGG_05976 [Chaetomium globosum CBS 148.51]|uniref:DNA repair metallo-beta-lactamase domain-containing protein n=1 Tax=Chaetomium globosum (strain ATCC 6205 / CBS 148.51 / DSM 1962 / NBRC 6347 / NRRL 1970) TaxID=306901 RepID=Q2H5T9_CHAGB|nr:uncharacterized protein CHGG_05976 [Chaetomium globosum CBS 148.51]EAQ89357.1 hypothetical protein CHGG_05976 [Chaetomium globosum CBS 148.51]
MAPLAKSKLSQTRLKTPQKPAARSTGPLSLPSATKGAKPKTKSKPNQSILSFFKKAPAPDEELFIGGGDNGVVMEEVEEEGQAKEVQEEDDDLYEASPSRANCEGEDAGGDDVRYNEVMGAVKRPRLSPALELGSSLVREKGEVSRPGSPEYLKQTDSKTALKAGPMAAPKRKAGNPFLDESSDEEDDDGDDKENEPVSSAIPRVRSPQRVFDNSNGGGRGTGPAKLTNGTTISRKPPLLRQQTSGADLGGDDNQAGAAQDGITEDNDDVDPFEDEDFTGEELRAMRYMEEQARLEAEEGGEEYERNDFVDDETMTECCPVCNGSLAGATPDQATAHVNSCLDGNPTPLPKPPGDVIETEGAAVGKRFAKAAVARPGQANPISLGAEAKEKSSNSAFTKLMSGHAEDAAWSTAAAAETAARGMPAYKRTCPFYRIMPGFSICVDAFRYGAVEGCQAYFLSHFHSDHYIGLTANWTHGPIYCSKVTGSLVKSQLKTAAKYVVELEFEKTVPVPDTNGVMVTMIPANHCPGSSLFLFEKTTGGRTQRVLHCGDFRACPAHVEHPKLRPETVDAITGRTKQQKIDASSPMTTANGDTLLRRQRGGASASNKVVSKFFTTASSSTSTKPTPPPPNNAFAALNGRHHNSNRLLVVCGTYSIGKERICVAIAQALQTKIYATPAKIRMCKQLDDPELASLLTSNPTEAQVHMQMLMELRAETLSEYLSAYKARGEFSHIIGFRPSGWKLPAPLHHHHPHNRQPPPNLPPHHAPPPQPILAPAVRGRANLVPQRGGHRGGAVLRRALQASTAVFASWRCFVMALRIERVVPTVGVGE